jgi:hypothetical protein
MAEKDVGGRPKNPPPPKKMLKSILPVTDIFKPDELIMFNDLVDVYLADFDSDDLTSSDMDDVLDLAKNRVLEFRLLKGSIDNADRQLDTAAAIEKLSKKNEKIKESLSSRRKDRINPNEFKGFSIIDLAVAFNNEKKLKLKDRMDKLKQEEEEMLAKREDYDGNRYDIDVKERDFDND